MPHKEDSSKGGEEVEGNKTYVKLSAIPVAKRDI